MDEKACAIGIGSFIELGDGMVMGGVTIGCWQRMEMFFMMALLIYLNTYHNYVLEAAHDPILGPPTKIDK